MLAYAHHRLLELTSIFYRKEESLCRFHKDSSFLISIHHLHFCCCFLSCSDSCYLNSNNSLPCSFSFLFNTALFCAKSLSYIHKKNYFTFILLFLKKSLDFFQPIIYHELIEDMFIFDYNPLLIYLYSPQKEQISLSALFTIYL